MRLMYTVHSAAEEGVPVKAIASGREIIATVPGLAIEMVCEEPVGRVHTFYLTPDTDADMEVAKATYVPGRKVQVVLSPVEE